jgi:hypothetical protein
VLRPAILSFQQTMRRMKMAKADLPAAMKGALEAEGATETKGVVLPYKAPARRAVAAALPRRRRDSGEPVAAAR